MKIKLTLLLFIILMAGCAPQNELVLFPGQLDPLSQLLNSENKEYVLSAEVDASIENTWDALVLILKQRSFIARVDAASESNRMLAYIDRTTLQIEKKEEVVEMPFQVVLQEKSPETTSITIMCRWDLITSHQYIKNKKQRYEDLKRGMISEAYILINQINIQATAAKRWNWIDKG